MDIFGPALARSVKLCPATADHDIRFRYVHARTVDPSGTTENSQRAD